MNQFCEMKGIKREFSVARNPQQNGVAKRKNRTLIEVARTVLADSKLPTTFWAEAVNTACYVHNRVLVTKPHNKTPYELFLGRKSALSFIRPCGCHVTILNIIDHLGSRPNWLFDIDALTKSMNYKPVVAENQFNGSAATIMDSRSSILFNLKDSPGAGYKPSGDEEKKDIEDPGNEDNEAPSTEEPRVNQEKDSVKRTNRVNVVSSTVNAASNQVDAVGLWYLKDSPFDLVAYIDSDYGGANLDKKSTIGGCQFLGCRLISWQCKKHTVVANSTTEAEYVAASSCCSQVLWIQNQLLNYRYNFMQTKIHIDNESTICTMKNPVFTQRQSTLRLDKTLSEIPMKNLIQMIKIHTGNNVAYLHTKAFDVGLSARVESSADEESLGEEDSSKHMRISDIDANQDIYLVNVYRDEDIFGVNDQDDTLMFDADKDLQSEEVVVEEINISTTKAKGLVMQESSETPRPTLIISTQQPSKVQDKGKEIMVEELLKMKKKDQILFDEEVARKLQEEIYKQERLVGERARQEEEANSALIKTWEDILTKV
nr:putative ribonuclease H-like domain-containing protein [Tanacetum cinerariifolium]